MGRAGETLPSKHMTDRSFGNHRRRQIAAATMNTDHTDAPNQSRHVGWDRGDYDTDDLGDFSGVEPDDGHSWHEELERVRDELVEIGSSRGLLNLHQKRRRSRLREIERTLERALNRGPFQVQTLTQIEPRTGVPDWDCTELVRRPLFDAKFSEVQP